jgi:hypothetical protein
MLWNGFFNLLENYSDITIWRELIYVFLGQFLMMVTASYLNVSCIDYEEPIEAVAGGRSIVSFASHCTAKNKLPPRSLLFYIRLSIALLGQLMHNSGYESSTIFPWLMSRRCWSILDIFIGTNSVIRNVVYVVVGTIMLLVTSSFHTNVGVVPPQFFRAHVDDEDAANPAATSIQTANPMGTSTVQSWSNRLYRHGASPLGQSGGGLGCLPQWQP